MSSSGNRNVFVGAFLWTLLYWWARSSAIRAKCTNSLCRWRRERTEVLLGCDLSKVCNLYLRSPARCLFCSAEHCRQGSKGTVPLSLTDWGCCLWYHCWAGDDTAVALCCRVLFGLHCFAKQGWVYQLYFWSWVSSNIPLPLPGERTRQRMWLLILLYEFEQVISFRSRFLHMWLRIVRGQGTQIFSGFASLVVTQCHC